MALSAFRFLLLLCMLAVHTFAAPQGLIRRLLNPTPPSQDPFYQPPAGFDKTAPGTILAYRQIPIPTVLTLLTPLVTKEVWQIQYRSTDSQGNAIAAVTSLFVPIDGDGSKLFTHSIAYDASNVDCSPSYQLRQLTNPTPEIAVIVLGLYNGWYVQSPDYESYEAAFGDGIVAGQAMLDSFRAVTASGNFTNMKPSARIAMNGGSGGALALEFALELHSTYAPEVNIVGATLGSLTPNVAHVYNTINGGPFAGLAPTAITGISKTNPQFAEYIQQTLVEKTAATFNNADDQCLSQNQADFANQNISLYFTNPNFLDAPAVKNTIDRVGVMGVHGVPKVPLYVYKGFGDEISDVEDTDKLVEKYCASGAPSIVYVRNIATGHETESILGIVGALEYIVERMNGVPAIEGCLYINSTKSALTNADQTALGNIGPLVINILKNALPDLITI